MKKFLKYLIIFLIGLAVLALALMFISPSKLVFEESDTMDANPLMVYNMVNDFKKWEDWSPWGEMDPEAENSYTSKTRGVGAQWSWKGEKVGEGSQTITESTKGEKIRTALKFSNWDGESYSDWHFTDVDGKTKVRWGFEGGETPFVMRPFNLLMKNGLIDTYKKGLNNIKKIVEERSQEKVYNGYKINEAYTGEKHYIMNRQVVELDKLDQAYTQILSSLFVKAQGTELDMDGMPSALFYSWDEEKGMSDMAAAIPLKTPISIPGTISQTLGDGTVIQVQHKGSHDNLEAAHYAIDDYLNDYGLLVNYPIVQEYLTDPSEVKDPSKWLTKISYYVTQSTQ